MKRVFLLIALAAIPAFADDVYLKGGGQITGQIIERTEESVTVDIGGAYLTAKTSSIVRIEESTSPLQEFRARAENTPAGDAEAWRELAQWAHNNTLTSQALDAYSQVVEILPDDEGANKALGRVFSQGRWVTEEQAYRAQGYVEFEHQWMTPQEQQAILADRRAREEANQQEIDAQVRAIEDEQRAQKEQEAAAHKNAVGWVQNENPVAWGWGAGPSNWPSIQGLDE